jgi:Ca2+-binding RTX toxin-like protein
MFLSGVRCLGRERVSGHWGRGKERVKTMKVKRVLVATATAALLLLPGVAQATMDGPDRDIIVGTAGADVLTAGGGDDVIYSGGGVDFVSGGRGFDVCYVSPGDTVKGCEVKI